MNLLTVGDVARKLGEPRNRVEYAIGKAGIQEHCRAGILRLFTLDQLPAIEASIGALRVRRPSPVATDK